MTQASTLPPLGIEVLALQVQVCTSLHAPPQESVCWLRNSTGLGGGQKRLGAAWPGASWSRMYCKMSVSSMAWICCCFCCLAKASDEPALGGTAGFLSSAGLAATGGLGLGWG